jgi:hypothetical protein
MRSKYSNDLETTINYNTTMTKKKRVLLSPQTMLTI